MKPAPEPPRPPTESGEEMNRRGGRVEILDPPSRVQEAQEESFPASDPPSNTPPEYVDRPPPPRS
jgi:hypothetical protein